MNKRAEEAGLKAYPKEMRDKTGFVIDIGHPQWIRDYYIDGYEQAEKDTIKLAQLWVDSGDANVMSFKQFLKRI